MLNSNYFNNSTHKKIVLGYLTYITVFLDLYEIKLYSNLQNNRYFILQKLPVLLWVRIVETTPKQIKDLTIYLQVFTNKNISMKKLLTDSKSNQCAQNKVRRWFTAELNSHTRF